MINQQEEGGEAEADEEGCEYTQGSTLLILACRRGHVDLVQWLLDHKGMYVRIEAVAYVRWELSS